MQVYLLTISFFHYTFTADTKLFYVSLYASTKGEWFRFLQVIADILSHILVL